MKALVLAAIAALIVTPLAAQQTVRRPATAALAIVRADGAVVTLEERTLMAMPRTTITAALHGKSATYTGTELKAVLAAAKIAPLDSLRGPALALSVVAIAADGYRMTIALSELDATIGNRSVLVVNRQDGEPLPAADGPWRLVIPADVRPARWVRQLVRLEIVPR